MSEIFKCVVNMYEFITLISCSFFMIIKFKLLHYYIKNISAHFSIEKVISIFKWPNKFNCSSFHMKSSPNVHKAQYFSNLLLSSKYFTFWNGISIPFYTGWMKKNIFINIITKKIIQKLFKKFRAWILQKIYGNCKQHSSWTTILEGKSKSLQNNDSIEVQIIESVIRGMHHIADVVSIVVA